MCFLILNDRYIFKITPSKATNSFDELYAKVMSYNYQTNIYIANKISRIFKLQLISSFYQFFLRNSKA